MRAIFSKTIFLTFVAALATAGPETTAKDRDKNRIKPYSKNPFYWQYKDRPVLLLGGTMEDNLFQIPNIVQHLDLLKSVGGNYVRCTMSSRDKGNVWPFKKVSDKYDLEQWNSDYWRRFDHFLKLTCQRDVIVQIEVWATYDFYRLTYWSINPFNPKNNINYTAAVSGLPQVIDYNPWAKIQPFFRTVPRLDDNPLVRKFQEAFVDKLLSYSLQYDNVLYCMDNESNTDPQWGRYWSQYIKTRAGEKGVKIETTEMWDKWDPSDGAVPGIKRTPTDEPHPYWDRPQVSFTLDHPQIYSFLDISNHNTQNGQTHYQTGQYVRRRVLDSGVIRPINCVKTYGGPLKSWWCGDPRDGLERFWRNIFGGFAACRFHRPRAGLGLSRTVQSHITSMRLLTAELDIFNSTPDSKSKLLTDRSDNEAYLTYVTDRQYAVYFPDGSSVGLNLSQAAGEFTLKWLDIDNSRWLNTVTVQAGSTITLDTPGPGHWAALLTKELNLKQKTSYRESRIN